MSRDPSYHKKPKLPPTFPLEETELAHLDGRVARRTREEIMASPRDPIHRSRASSRANTRPPSPAESSRACNSPTVLQGSHFGSLAALSSAAFIPPRIPDPRNTPAPIPPVPDFDEGLDYDSGNDSGDEDLDMKVEPTDGPVEPPARLSEFPFQTDLPHSPLSQPPAPMTPVDELSNLGVKRCFKEIAKNLNWLSRENVKHFDQVHAIHANLIQTAMAVLKISDAFEKEGDFSKSLSSFRTRLEGTLTENLTNVIVEKLSSFEEKFEQALTNLSSSNSARFNALDQKVANIQSTVTAIQSRPSPISQPTSSPAPAPSPPRLSPPPVVTLSTAQLQREKESKLVVSKKRSTAIKRQLKILSDSQPEELLNILQEQVKTIKKVKETGSFYHPEGWFPEDNWTGFESLDLDSRNLTDLPGPSNVTPTNPPQPKPKVQKTFPNPAKSAHVTNLTEASPAQQKRFSSPKSQSWVVKLSAPIPEENRLNPREIWSRVSSVRNAFPFTFLRSTWSNSGQWLFLFFSEDTNPENIRTNAKQIVEALGCPDAEFVPTVRSSKVMLAPIPCRDPDNMDQTIHPSVIMEQLNNHLLFSRLEHIAPPKWVTADIDSKQSGTLMIQFKDTEGSYATDLINRAPYYVFGNRVSAFTPTDRVSLVQCSRCLKFGKEHVNCKVVCSSCGSLEHTTESHGDHCRSCVETGKKEPCSHFQCSNCRGPHPATDESCPHRATAISAERKRRADLKNRPARY